jgi:hypothetical protein
LDGHATIVRFRQGGYAMLVQVHTATIRGLTAAIIMRHCS